MRPQEKKQEGNIEILEVVEYVRRPTDPNLGSGLSKEG
jgi:hypothetical protein